jgi:DNA excision repair protein ERCC-4
MKMTILFDLPKIVIDSREQRPFPFTNSIVKKLDSGDYSLEGLEHLITIERKSKEDAYGSLGAGRERFKREFQRMAKYRYAACVIECSLESFLNPPYHSELNPKSAINTLMSWQIEFNVHVLFAGTRQSAMAATAQYLRHFYRLYKLKKLGIKTDVGDLEKLQGDGFTTPRLATDIRVATEPKTRDKRLQDGAVSST